MHSEIVMPSAGRALATIFSARPWSGGSASAMLRGQRREQVHLRLAAAGDVLDVALHVRKLGVEAEGGAEELLGRLEGAQLVERDAQQVQQDGLTGLLLEGGHQPAHQAQVERRGGLVRHVAGGVEGGLDQDPARAEAAVDVGDARGVGPESVVAVEVLRADARGSQLGELGRSAAVGLGSRLGCGEAESHVVRVLPGGRGTPP
jgi:hypothetical protein